MIEKTQKNKKTKFDKKKPQRLWKNLRKKT